MLQIFILFIIIVEFLQILLSKIKVIRWILPLLNFLIAIFIEINLIVFSMFNESKSLLQVIDYEVVLLFVIMNIPTILFILTNIIVSKYKFECSK